MLDDEQYGRQLGGRLRYEVDDLSARPDLAGVVRGRQARRARAVRAAIGASVAAAVASAVVVTTAGPGATGGGHRTGSVAQSTGGSEVRLQNVAYVRTKTVEALAQADQYVIQAKTTYDGGHYDQWFDKAEQRYRVDDYTTLVDAPRKDGRLPASPDQMPRGPEHLRSSTSVSGPAGDQDTVTVDYEQRTWFATHETRVEEPGPVPDITDADAVRTAMDDGTLELVGEETVDGVDTLHVLLYGPQKSYRIDMWVDTTTYLPVKEIAAKGSAESGGQFQADATLTTKYSWLPRSEENLAHLVVTAPPGFRRVG